jgi:hypothetical protein
MPQSLSDLEQRREVIAQRIAQLGDLRPGSITRHVRAAAGSRTVAVINLASLVTAPISGSPIRSMARPSPKRYRPRQRSRRRRRKSRSSGNSSSSLVSFWGPTRRSAVCALLRSRWRWS